MNMFDPHAYTITVKRALIDGELLYSASVAEMPDVEAFEPTYKDAYEIAIDAIKALKVLADEAGQSFPPPLEYVQDYSGRITLRAPTSLHRQLVMRAATEKVSLNTLIVAMLSGAYSAVKAAPAWDRHSIFSQLFESRFGKPIDQFPTMATVGVVPQEMLPRSEQTVRTIATFPLSRRREAHEHG